MNKFLLPFGLALYVCAAPFAQAGDAPAGQTESKPNINYKLPPTPAAEIGNSLTLKQAIALAFNANPELSAAARELDAVEASLVQAGVRPNPELSILQEDTRKKTSTTTLQLNQLLETGGKRGARIAVAEKGRDAAQAELLAKRADIQALVVGSYFEVLEAQEHVQLLQSALQLAQRATLIAAKRVAAGKVAPLEESKARVAEAGVGVELQQAVSTLSSGRRRLAATWGNPSLDSAAAAFVRVDGQLDQVPPLPELLSLLTRLQSAPAMQRARLEVERREAMTRLERSRRVPDVTVSVGAKRAQELGRNQLVVGLAMPIPVFDRNQGNLLEALRRSDKARDELRGAEVRLNAELLDAHERLKLARLQVASLQSEILPSAQNTYDRTLKGFELGKFSFLEVLDAQRVLFQAKSQTLRALADTHRAATDIERVLGTSPSTDSL
ncbi:TolC family protein [Paraherbaspirillum soli]|uniref:TolC family protein n=1 Tax=Paraherbaspirillum soli TaxID=631222 RepID=A0ABW0MAS2_9BURK